MVYAQQIKESKIRETRQEGKTTRSDYFSNQTPKRRFYHQEYSMGNNYRDPNQNSCGGGHTFERRRYATCGKQHFGRCLFGTDGFIACVNKGHKMRDCPKIKAIGKEVNQASLYPNAPKKNPSQAMGVSKDN